MTFKQKGACVVIEEMKTLFGFGGAKQKQLLADDESIGKIAKNVVSLLNDEKKRLEQESKQLTVPVCKSEITNVYCFRLLTVGNFDDLIFDKTDAFDWRYDDHDALRNISEQMRSKNKGIMSCKFYSESDGVVHSLDNVQIVIGNVNRVVCFNEDIDSRVFVEITESNFINLMGA